MQGGHAASRGAPCCAKPLACRSTSRSAPRPPRAIKKPDVDSSLSRSERVTRDIELDLERLEAVTLSDAEPSELEQLDEAINRAYSDFFAVGELQLDDGTSRVFDAVDEREMQRLGRQEPQVSGHAREPSHLVK